jgi:FkbM family methyltransferase
LRAAPGPIIDRFFGGKHCFFVQVGSNDGVTADPLYDLVKANPQWRGLFIEPLEDCFSKLVANYAAESRFVFEQVAIADSAGERPFYSLSPDGIRETGIPASFDVFSSLDRDYVLKELTRALRIYAPRAPKEPAAYLAERAVRCEPLMSVLDRHRVDRVDLFHVDAESYDYKIISQIDFDRFRPKLILYEHCTLNPGHLQAARALLSRNGYDLVDCGHVDTMAVRRR